MNDEKTDYSHSHFLQVIYSESKTKNKMRLHIVTTARELFSERLISDVSVTDICNMASIERKTFYRYYTRKERLAFEIRMCILLDLFAFQKDNYTYDKNINGYQNFQCFIDQVYTKTLVEQVDKFRNHYRFLSHFDYMSYWLDVDDVDAKDFLMWVKQMNVTTVQDILKIGENDNSICLHGNTPVEMSGILMQSFSSIILRAFLIETTEKPVNAKGVISAIKLLLLGLKNNDII